MSSDYEKAHLTIFRKKERTLHVHEISVFILFLDFLIIIFLPIAQSWRQF